MSKVVVAMSGGVDSSVAAALLKAEGYEVIGMMLRLWSEPGSETQNRCCTPNDMALARRVAAQLSIPFYAVDGKDAFFNTVVNYFISGYTNGITPNPCLVCNRQIRWEFLLNHALEMGADFMATGHYARLQGFDGSPHSMDKQPIKLLRAIDKSKDQSYVLHVLNQCQLTRAMFPLGEFTKNQVREKARKLNLPVSERPDSQDLCFLGDDDYRDFLLRNVPEVAHPGPILTTNREQLGEHQGLAFYTVGQRKGLGISAPFPLYVLEKDIENNSLLVGPKEQLGKTDLTTGKVNWITGQEPQNPIRATIKIRYKAREVDGLITPQEGSRSHVKFTKPQRDITPGQAAVFYNEEVCLGGGIIE